MHRGVEHIQSLTVGITLSETLLWAAVMVGGWQQTEHEKDFAIMGVKVVVTGKRHCFLILSFLSRV